jgi:hypothetical protein
MDLFPARYAAFAADYASGPARAATMAREQAAWAGPRDYVEKEVPSCPSTPTSTATRQITEAFLLYIYNADAGIYLF